MNVRTVSILALIAALFACKSTTSLRVTSSPEGAAVIQEITTGAVVREVPLGRTPLNRTIGWGNLRSGQGVRIRVEAEGYYPKTEVLSRSQRDSTLHLDLDPAPFRELFTPTLEVDPQRGFVFRLNRTRAYSEALERDGEAPELIFKGRDLEFLSSLVFDGQGGLLFVKHLVEFDSESGEAFSRAANLWRLPAESEGAPQRITDGTHANIDPAISPDGKYVYLATNRHGSNFDIVRMPLEGPLRFTRVIGGVTHDRQPTFGSVEVARRPGSPAFVAYTSVPRYGIGPEIWTKGGNEEGYPSQLREGHSPAVSPDGTLIAFIGPDGHVWTMTSRGGEQRPITSWPDSTEMEPCWSPDGRWLVFVSDHGRDQEDNPNNDIWAYDMQTGEPTRLTTNGSDDRSPAFHPRTSHIYFVSSRGLNWNIWRMDFEGGASEEGSGDS